MPTSDFASYGSLKYSETKSSLSQEEEDETLSAATEWDSERPREVCLNIVSQLPAKELYRIHLLKIIEKTERNGLHRPPNLESRSRNTVTGTPVEVWALSQVKRVNGWNYITNPNCCFCA